jgi:hypothetical protein
MKTKNTRPTGSRGSVGKALVKAIASLTEEQPKAPVVDKSADILAMLFAQNQKLMDMLLAQKDNSHHRHRHGHHRHHDNDDDEESTSS